MTRLNELRLISRVAQMYHLEGRRQAEIAQHLRLSQATVSRMLKRAEAEDIVRTSVTPPVGTYSELESTLRERYDLPEAIVVECTEDRDGAIMARIGEAAAHLLEVTLAPGEIIGVSSWSQTISKMVENIHPLKSAPAKYVVQTLGGMGDPSVQTHATQLTTRLARLTGAEPKLLAVQGVTTSREAKLLMQADPYVRETMDLFGSITLAIVGIGAVEPSELLARSGNIFSSRELSDLAEAEPSAISLFASSIRTASRSRRPWTTGLSAFHSRILNEWTGSLLLPADPKRLTRLQARSAWGSSTCLLRTSLPRSD